MWWDLSEGRFPRQMCSCCSSTHQVGISSCGDDGGAVVMPIKMVIMVMLMMLMIVTMIMLLLIDSPGGIL